MCKYLTSLKIIDCKNFKRLPNELGNLEALEKLKVKGTAIREVPKGIQDLSKLTSLDISYCGRLQTLPKLPCNLHYLNASVCTSLEALSAGLSSISVDLSVDLRDCLKLDPNEVSEIVKDGWMKQVCLLT